MSGLLASLARTQTALIASAWRIMGIASQSSTMTGSYTTQVLVCDSSTISFDPEADFPKFTSPHTLASLDTASQHLHSLQCVAFPTETVYGLGALALDSAAASKIFSTKGRPPDNPLIVHVSSLAMLRSILPNGYTLPESYEVLMKHFWPGALTLLFPRDPTRIPEIITAGQPTVAIRMPSHPVARALIAVANAPIAAPSANSSGKPSPTRAEHVRRDLDGKVGIILDGGACAVGLESTVIDGLNEDGNIRVLRPGGVTVEEIERVLKAEMKNRIPEVLVHRRDYRDDAMEAAPTTPGMKYRHYSPAVPVILLLAGADSLPGADAISASSFLEGLAERATDPSRRLKVGVLAQSDSPLATCTLPKSITWQLYPLGPISDASVTAHRLFDGLLTLEQEGVDLILIEEISEAKEGLAVMNRVRKAAGETQRVIYP
ncbi:translation factor [Athelia psychrophila]|uniref:Threonylcarbamoyl-AMP synthase n=1 Tax=Athelia psychrophila TaxID=1759441 RepID=A0A166UA68_9AGAM|nr:translation factor [Fibularhizoctonia sp. CBS 109695]